MIFAGCSSASSHLTEMKHCGRKTIESRKETTGTAATLPDVPCMVYYGIFIFIHIRLRLMVHVYINLTYMEQFGNESFEKKNTKTIHGTVGNQRQVEEVDDEMHLLKMKPRILGGQIAKAPFIEIEIEIGGEAACHAESCLTPTKTRQKNWWVETRKAWLVFVCEVRPAHFCEAHFFVGGEQYEQLSSFFWGGETSSKHALSDSDLRFFRVFWGGGGLTRVPKKVTSR